ncbi:zf-HC2 domain-containing protein, partial [Streptomyces sp. SID2563]|uniref:zf-HC2 domain-containing protein n=1 Tax=Streptomyces sp. SID2563 TaxID=2690255 RepID=UPI0031FF02DC
MTTWHVTDELVLRYAEGTAPEPDAWSVEMHVESCTGCAERVSAAVRDRGAGAATLDAIRAAVLAEAMTKPAPAAGTWRRVRGAGAPRAGARRL